jgi:hypothetical protein
MAVEAPGLLRYLGGVIVMVVGVVVPLAYAFLKKKVPAKLSTRT